MALISTRQAGAVLAIEMQHAAAGGALTAALRRELADAWSDFDARDDVAVAVLSGESGTFSAGDGDAVRGDDPASTLSLFPMRLRKPVIAAVEGSCFGLGFELALACDLRVAAADARFGFPDVEHPAAHDVASVLLPRMLPMGRALELLLTGRTMTGGELHAARLVNRVASPAVDAAMALAADLAGKADGGASLAKTRIWGTSGLPIPHAMTLARRVGPGGI